MMKGDPAFRMLPDEETDSRNISPPQGSTSHSWKGTGSHRALGRGTGQAAGSAVPLARPWSKEECEAAEWG